MGAKHREPGRREDTSVCRWPEEWWKSDLLTRSLVAHPAGGAHKVAAVREVISGCGAYAVVAPRVGVSAFLLQQWAEELEQVVATDLWPQYLRWRRQAKQAQPHPFLAYYGG